MSKSNGRPKSENPKSEKVQIRLTKAELKKLDKLKEKKGLSSRSDLIRMVLKENNII